MKETGGILLAAGIVAWMGGNGSAALSGWRGDGTGRYPDATPPLAWSASSNIVWKTAMPGRSNASPLPLGDRLFVCSEPDLLLCVSQKEGSVLWAATNSYASILTAAEAEKAQKDQAQRAEVEGRMRPIKADVKKLDGQIKKDDTNAELKTRRDQLKTEIARLQAELPADNRYALPPSHEVNGYSSPTPATDGRDVFAVFGTGVVASYDTQGKRRWVRFLEKPKEGWGHSASPLVVGNRLIVHVVKVTALDTATGGIVWQTDSKPAWGSEIPARLGDTDVAITPGGDLIRAKDGVKLASQLSGLSYCAPIMDGRVVFFAQNGGKAIRLPETASEPFKTETLWTTKPKNERYYASPVCHQGLIYAITQQGDLSVINAADGAVVATKKMDLGGTVYPSITLAGGNLYVSSDSGKTAVLKPGKELEILATNTLEPFRSTPVFMGTRLYVRTLKNLYCIGK